MRQSDWRQDEHNDGHRRDEYGFQRTALLVCVISSAILHAVAHDGRGDGHGKACEACLLAHENGQGC